MRKLNLEDAKKYVLQAVQERGREYNYKENFDFCQYSSMGKPACLVGLAFSYIEKDWGIEGLLRKMSDAGGDAVTTWHYLKSAEILEISKPAAMFLKLAQSQQDQGKTWGEAYDVASTFYFAHKALHEV